MSDKLNIYKMLITAVGVLYGIDTELIDKHITVLKELAEDRNTIIIHGLLSIDKNAQIVFHGRGSDIEATLSGLSKFDKAML